MNLKIPVQNPCLRISHGFTEPGFFLCITNLRWKLSIRRLTQSVQELLVLNSTMHMPLRVHEHVWHSIGFLNSIPFLKVSLQCSQVTPLIVYESTSRSPSSFVCRSR